MIDSDRTVLGVVTTLDAGPLHFLAGGLPVDAEPAGALMDELLSAALPKLTVVVRVNDGHTLTCSLFSRPREVGCAGPRRPVRTMLGLRVGQPHRGRTQAPGAQRCGPPCGTL
ncbi:MAG: hypothetical protein OXC31_11865 [Spirochaetaceae bacterium]|nr:hypothetical protein [Spirochaetaceae bacterium]